MCTLLLLWLCKGGGGGQRRPSLYNRHACRYHYLKSNTKQQSHEKNTCIHPLHIIMLISMFDVNALYIFDGSITGSSYVAESRCYINTWELTNREGHCTSLYPMPQIANVEQMQSLSCRIAHLSSCINHGLTLTYLNSDPCFIQLTGNEVLAALRTGTRFWKGYV